MDLYAYAQIKDLEEIAKANGIEVPRLRGYRLMKDEEAVSEERIAEMKQDGIVQVVGQLCDGYPFWSLHPQYYTLCDRTDRIKARYLIENTKDPENPKIYTGIRWDRIHGKKRKVLKHAIKLQNKAIQKQYDMWNKYVGRDDVLYIHAKLGHNSWASLDDRTNMTRQPWFLDKIDDYWDPVYCDIYAKINMETDKQ